MTLRKAAIQRFAGVALLLATGCGTTGWLPSAKIAVAGVDRTEYQHEQAARKKFLLEAYAHLLWKLEPAEVYPFAKTDYDRKIRLLKSDRNRCHHHCLCRWEDIERNRVIAQTDESWAK
ncbi:MAG: hypothetical protein JXA30_02940 [Deltaproteobacteria bacterium]|nr:hypothetical protein [Deltaproteobacteria bacterium]